MRLVKHESAIMNSQDPTDGLEYDKKHHQKIKSSPSAE